MESETARQQLAERAEKAAITAISDQALSLDDFNRMVSAADDDPVLEQRLLRAAVDD